METHQQHNQVNTDQDTHGHHRSNPVDKERIAKTQRDVFGFFVTRTRVTLLLIVAIVFGGFYALSNIPREADPEVKIPIAVVSTFFPGASPADVEDLVTEEIEAKIEDLDDVKLVTSQSRLGLSSITVEFDAEADLDDSIRELKDKVLEVTGLPEEAEDPIVTQIRANDTPIIAFSLAGNLDELRFKQLGEYLQDELEKISGVSEVQLLGVREREFSVEVDKAALERLQLPLSAVVGAVASSNTDTPLGDISIDSVKYNIRTVAKITSLDELRNIVVTTQDGEPVLLSDVAQVDDQFADRQTLSRISVNGEPTVNTITLQILKKTGGNILDIVDEAKQTLDEFKAEGVIPAFISIEVSSDFSDFIRDDLSTLGRSGIQAIIAIFIIMLLALSFKEALISVFAVPLTFLITFLVLYLRGDTINSLSLFALVLSLGLLVDTFIVILEGIFHNMRAGYRARESALLSIAHYRKPLLAGTFTTISAFVPMLLVSGILGEYLKVLPITIATTLLASLFVSLVIVPAIASVFLKKRLPQAEKKESLLEKYLTNWLTRVYVDHVKVFLRSKKQKIVFTITVVIAFIGSLVLLISPVVPVKLFPEVDIEFSWIDIEMPIGTELAVTEEVVREVEAVLFERDDIKNFVSTVGSATTFTGFGFGSQLDEHLASINVNFVPLEERDLKSYEIIGELRQAVRGIEKGKITIREISAGPPTGDPIEVRILGDDLTELDHLTDQLVGLMKETEGVIDIETDRDVSPADITFRLDRSALARSGLSVNDVAGYLRTAIFGVTATEVTVDGDDLDVVVRFNESTVDSIDALRNISLINNRGEVVKLNRVADFSLEPALATIRHRDFERTATVRASLEPGFVPAQVVPQLEREMIAEGIPEGYQVNFGGEVEDIEQSFSELWAAMIIAVLLIIFILVLQFESFKTPFAIMMALPLTLPGVVIGMSIFGLPFSFSVFIGLISLAGIVVNDAIVLLDKARRNLSELKMSPTDALINAGQTRLQPILLTSVTTIAGVIPLALADEFWFGLSITVAFGLLFGTILQLYVVPMIFLKLEGKRALIQSTK